MTETFEELENAVTVRDVANSWDGTVPLTKGQKKHLEQVEEEIGEYMDDVRLGIAKPLVIDIEAAMAKARRIEEFRRTRNELIPEYLRSIRED